jgi:hypothetical protein
MTRTVQFQTLPPFGGDQRQVAEVVRGIMNGKTNNTGMVTLNTGGATSTTIYDSRIGNESVILLSATSTTSTIGELPYGAFQDSTTQSISSTTTAYVATFNTTDYSNGVSLVSGSRMKVAYSGLYNLQFSAQLENSDTQIHKTSIWFRKNGTDIPKSNTEFDVINSHGGAYGNICAALNFFVDLAKDDYVEIAWSSVSTQVTIAAIAAQTSPTRPATPSIIATMQYVSSDGYTSNIFRSPYISSKAQGSAVISHPANSTSGITYDYIVVG